MATNYSVLLPCNMRPTAGSESGFCEIKIPDFKKALFSRISHTAE